MSRRKPKLAVWKFSSCDGCQLSLLNCEQQLLALAERVVIARFAEATSATAPGPYDISLVEGSVSTPDDIPRIERIRQRSKVLVAIGACATAGGIQALRNFADVADYVHAVYPTPHTISALATSTGLAEHVKVDFELPGCPVNERQLIEVVDALLRGRRPQIEAGSVCLECKRRGTTCILVAQGTPCLGPVTRAGCGALCPSHDRGCYGCFGPQEIAHTAPLNRRLRVLGASRQDLVRLYRMENAHARAFAETSRRLETQDD